jgi:hypothetical protein
MRRRRETILLSAGMALAASAAIARAEQQIVIAADADKYCSFDADGAFSGLSNIGVDSTARPTSVVHVQNPADAAGFMRSANFTFIIHTTCNAPSQYQLRSANGGLTNPAPLPLSGTWVNRIDYSAHVTLPALGGFTSSLNTNGTANAVSALQTNGVAYVGQLQVSFAVIQNLAGPMVAGNYSDTLTIVVNPQ